MAVNIGPRIGIDGEAEYRRSLQNIIQEQKTLKAEMEKTASAFNKSTSAQEKHKKQVELLNKQVEVQKDRVAKLAEGYNASVQKTGEASAATLKWKQALIEAESELNRLQSELQSNTGLEYFSSQLKTAGEKMVEIGTNVKDVGDTLTKTVTGPIVGFGAAALAAFGEVDKGSDTLIRKTGASGEALDAMEQSMKNLATTIPTSFESAGEAIGEVNTRFGLTGQELEDLSGQFLKFAELNDTDVSSSIDGVQKLMASFGLETQDAGKVLDTLNKTGQDTGIGMNTLMQSLVTNGSALRDMGLSASDSITLLGQLEKSGVDMSVVMTGLAKVQKTALEDGISVSEAMTQAVSSSGDAIDIFGAKAGPKLYEAFQTGILSMDMFTSGATTLNDSVGSVSETFDATLDPMDSWQTTLNELTIAGAELGNAIGPVLTPIIKEVGEAAKAAGEWFKGLDEDQKNLLITAAGAIAVIGPIVSIIGSIIIGVGQLTAAFGVISGALPAVGAAFGAVGAVLSGPVVLAIGAVIAAGVLIIKHWDEIKAGAKQLADNVKQKWNDLKANTKEAWENIKSSIGDKVNEAKEKATTGFENLKTNVTTKISNTASTVGQKLGDMASNFRTKVGEAESTVQSKYQSIQSKIEDALRSAGVSVNTDLGTMASDFVTQAGNMLSTVTTDFGDIQTKMGDAIGDAYTTVSGKLGDIATAFGEKMGLSETSVTDAIGRIKEAFNFSWSLPPLKLPHISISGSFSLDPPSVPHFSIEWYRKAYDQAMLFTSPTVLPTGAGLKGFGDGPGGEIVIGTNRLLSIMQNAAAAAGNQNSVVINVYGAPGQDIYELADIIEERINANIRRSEEVFA